MHDLTNGRTESYDVIVVGGGHNGLVCACYLAQAGHKVKVIERRPIVGGAATTEEFHSGFRNSICAYSISVLNPKIINDLNLTEYGLRIDSRSCLHFLPLSDGRSLSTYADPEQTQAAFARFSERDAETLPQFYAMLDRLAGAGDTWLQTPPNVGGSKLEIFKALWSNRKMASMDIDAQRDLADLMVMSAADFVDRWFESETVKAVTSVPAVIGFMVSPFTPGTANVLLHRCVSEVNGRKGVWGHVRGGMGSITQAMAESAMETGVEIEVSAAVVEVLAEGGQVRGVRLEDGRTIRSRAVASNLNPKLLFRDFVDSSLTSASFRTRMENYRCVSGTFRMNLALSELPDFACAPGTDVQEHHTSSIVIAPSLDYMDNAHQDARRHGWSRDPIVQLLIPSSIDDSLAPEGKHVASLLAQHFNPNLPGGHSWDDVREEAADAIIDKVTEYAPNFKASVIARQILSPLDLEREFGLLGGDIFHGTLDLNQIYCLRPTLGHADYRMPIKGLYLCGAGAHPGGGVSGAPGHNAAQEIIKDMGKPAGKRWYSVFSRKIQ